MKTLLLITSGTGPVEVRRFVALLAERFVEVAESSGLDVLAQQVEGPYDSPRCVSLQLDGDARTALAGELGTHALIARSDERSRRDRKRWFASVELVPVHEQPGSHIREGDLVFQAVRSCGPGGQNVNRRATAVRVTDPTSGLAVRAQGERSQAQNRAVAVERLKELLTRRGRVKAAEASASLHVLRRKVTRGNPVRVYRLERGVLQEVNRDREQ